MAKQELLDTIENLMDEEYKRGKNHILEVLEDELKSPTCLTCEYCVEFHPRPFLSDCLHPENKKNKEFMEMFEGYYDNFEVEAPKKFGCHKFNFEKFKKTCEILEGE